MQERLLDSLANSDDVYDPFESPPSINKAEKHRKAIAVGKDVDES